MICFLFLNRGLRLMITLLSTDNMSHQLWWWEQWCYGGYFFPHIGMRHDYMSNWTIDYSAILFALYTVCVDY